MIDKEKTISAFRAYCQFRGGRLNDLANEFLASLQEEEAYDLFSGGGNSANWYRDFSDFVKSIRL